ncbi:MAG: hypothetical protein M3P83_09640, partial [Actinomycetota bacterium]|nr:hypothetical protein [Actinomycetota bacterium]
MDNHEFDDLGDAIRRALHEEAEMVQPGDDGLTAIRRRTAAPAGMGGDASGTSTRRRVWLGVTAGALATAATVVAAVAVTGVLSGGQP